MGQLGTASRPMTRNQKSEFERWMRRKDGLHSRPSRVGAFLGPSRTFFRAGYHSSLSFGRLRTEYQIVAEWVTDIQVRVPP